MDGQQQSPSCSPKAKRSKTVGQVDQSPRDERELDEEEQRAFNEVESEISQLLSSGIQDVSIIGNEEECASVWAHIERSYGDGEAEANDEFGIDPRLKDAIRAFAEGSLLPIHSLIRDLRKRIAPLGDIVNGDLSDVRFATLIPVFVTRKNLGEAFASTNATARMESDRRECLWVWEAPSLDVFPQPLQERMKAARETRTLISKRYKALMRLTDAIKKGDKAAKSAANDQLSAIYKKMLLEREKRERMESKRKAEELKAQQMRSLFTKGGYAKETKTTCKTAPQLMRDKQSKTSAKSTAKTASKPPNMLLNWLKSSTAGKPASAGGEGAAVKTSSVNVTVSPSAVEARKVSVTEEAVPSTAASIGEFDAMGATEAQMLELSKYIANLPHNIKAAMTVEAAKGRACESYQTDRDGQFDDFLKLCENHRESWMRFFTYVHSNRKFYVETRTNTDEGTVGAAPTPEAVSRSFAVDDLINNIDDTGYGDPTLRQERYSRVFHMSDNDWKRPSMRLVVSRSSQHIKATDPLSIEAVMDYFADSDEEWFENYDVDDVDVSGSEEEDEEDEDNDWIVQDNPQQDLQKHTLNLCEVVKVYCQHKHWHWIVDGVPQNNDECCSVEEARKNGINVLPSHYGFGYEGYTSNPITDFVSGMLGHRVIMTTEDVQEFLKHCHGKHTKKEYLIQEFKEMKPFCSTAEIKDKFKKYMCRMKVDNTPQRWLVTTEAALLFGIRDELDAILSQAMEQVTDDA